MMYTPDEMHEWHEFMVRRAVAAAQTEADYAAAAVKARADALVWIESESRIKGSFLWVCDLLGLEPEAVRKAIAERAK